MTGGGSGLPRLDIELEEKKHRIEHAAQVTKAAVRMAYYWRRRHAGRGHRTFKKLELTGDEATGRAHYQAIP